MTRRSPQNNPLEQSSRWWHHLKLSTQKFAVLLVISASLSGFGYVLLTNQTAAQGFAIDDLETQLADVRTANEKLELQAADLRSLSGVELTSQTLALEPADGFEYLPASGAVAVSTR